MVPEGGFDMRVLGFFVFGLLLLWSVSGWFFTLIVDLSMIIVSGYVISYLLFKFITPRWPWIGVFAPFLLPLSVLALYVGGLLPYFNLMEPEAVYFYLLPKSWLGISGNDFMWNGLTLPLIGRVMPLEMIPTCKNFPLHPINLFAYVIWTLMPVVMVWSSLCGSADAVDNRMAWYKIFVPNLLKMILLAVIVWILLMSIARFLVWIYL
jgi:hypothetical protein